MLTKTVIEKYFVAEKNTALIFIILGIVAIVVALIGLLWVKTTFFKGAAFPLMIIAVIQMVVGFTIYTRSDKDRVRVVYALDMDPTAITEQELPRMQKVVKSLTLYKTLEIFLIIFSITCLLLYKNNLFWKGFATALLLQSLIMIVADNFAQKRAKEYTFLLEKFTP